MSISQDRLSAALAEDIRALMARKRLSQGDIAGAIGRSQSYVSRRLSGEGSFDVSDLGGIAKLLGENPGTILSGAWTQIHGQSNIHQLPRKPITNLADYPGLYEPTEEELAGSAVAHDPDDDFEREQEEMEDES